MMAKCDICKTTFDSHDGGFACQKCGATFCPNCEAIPEGADEPVCPKCDGLDHLEEAQTSVTVDMKPKRMQSRRAMMLYYTATASGVSIAMWFASTQLLKEVQSWCPWQFWFIMWFGSFMIAMGNLWLIRKDDKK